MIRIGTRLCFTASTASAPCKRKCPNRTAPMFAIHHMKCGGSFRSLLTRMMISFGVVNGASAITPLTLCGRSMPVAISTVAAPMEMPHSTICTESPKRRTA